MRRALLLCLIVWHLSAADNTGLRAMFEAHHWFDLHDAVSDSSPLFYRLVTAAAFNDIRGAEKLMSALLRSASDKEQLRGAHYAMFRLYQRNGRYRKAAAEARQVFDAPAPGESNPDWSDMEAMEKLPDIAVASRHPGTVAYTHWPSDPYLVAPLNINGHDAQYAMDTGAGMSVTVESEAKRLGLTILPGTPVLDGITGARTAQGRYAYARRLKIANMELRNVAFLVLPDDIMDFFGKLPQHQRGVIGMPILLASGGVRWTRGGDVTFGFAGGAKSQGLTGDANVAFDGLVPVTNWEIAKHRLAVELDSGSAGTFVWPRYMLDFPELIPSVPEGKTTMNGAAGSTEIRSLTFPELRFTVGGFQIVYEKATALLQTTIPASNWLYGLFGKDQLDKAQEVSLDLRAMKLQLK